MPELSTDCRLIIDLAVVAAMEKIDQKSIVDLANRVSELADMQYKHGLGSQGKLVEAVQSLQVAVEGPAHYVARMRHQVRTHVLRTRSLQSLTTGH